METSYIKASQIDKKWFVVDATDKTLGRLSSKVAQVLRGKNKVNYTPHMDMGDFVIIVNADKVKLSGKKESSKDYFKHTNYPGGARNISIKIIKTQVDKEVMIDEHGREDTQSFKGTTFNRPLTSVDMFLFFLEPTVAGLSYGNT